VSSGDRERSGSCGCRGKEGARGSLLGVECELRARSVTLSLGLNASSGQSLRPLLGVEGDQTGIEFVVCLMRLWCGWAHVAI